MAVRYGISLSRKSAVLMYYGIILSERYSIAAVGKAHIFSLQFHTRCLSMHLIIDQMVLFIL